MSKIKTGSPMKRFIHTKVNGGVILLVVAFVTMLIANSPLSEAYNNFFSQKLVLKFGDINLLKINGQDMTLLSFINDALMCIFFFSVGLEIKREILVGELASFKKAMLPIVTACGGMIVPILLFFIIGPSGDAQRGAAIPMATDIAFSIGVLSLLGKKVPLGLKIFLTAFAVVDDIGGIVVIALFYSSNLMFEYLIYGLIITFIMWAAGRLGMTSKLFFFSMGVGVWYCFMNSGIHPTIAGVITAFAIPARTKISPYKFVDNIRECLSTLPSYNKAHHPMMLTPHEVETLKVVESNSDRVISPLQSLDDNLHPLIDFMIMPLFAVANANVTFGNISFASVEGVTLSIFISLVAGKTIGLFSFTWLAVKSKLLTLPSGMNFTNLLGVSILGGIGFTVSLFLANLSYSGLTGGESDFLNEAKMGIISGSVFAGICGYLFLRKVLKEDQPDGESIENILNLKGDDK